ncbi:MAG: lipase maturation factor family protein [Deltaproteobacteria bacterium]|nr:lipase maturation factor family protein [Deltaproteobacteria bacterium]
MLIGSQGLLPLAPLLETLHARPDVHLWDFPTLFWWNASDPAIHAGIWAGVTLSVLALAGAWPRVCILLLLPLYLSYAVACRDFLSFQWDNLLLECGFLALALPRDRRAAWIHLLFRLLLLKLYWESGIAKWQSHLHDWHDGSAMTFYYETAPLPTWIAWHAHHLPAWWHHFESRAVLLVELVVPLLIFGPRAARLFAFAVFTGFQILNIATANYGFFCYITLALHLFLLDERDLVRMRAALLGWWPRPPPAANRTSLWTRARALRMPRRAGAVALCTFFLGASLIEGIRRFADAPGFRKATTPLREIYAPFRLVNTYHLFGHITRSRTEPEFQTFREGTWTAHDLRFKPGAEDRAPPFVAPHQPRVDFRLWFYGLGSRRGTPRYVRTLIDRLCEAPDTVQSLFSGELPRAPQAVRVAFWTYHFSSAEERKRTGAYWTRARAGASPPNRCAESAGARSKMAPP